MLMACEKYNAIPMVEPIFSPKERDIIKYSPPPSTRVFVASSEMASAVGMVIRCPRMIIVKTPQNPSVPTAIPNRRKRIAPRIVEIAVKNTGAVPKPAFCVVTVFSVIDNGFYFTWLK